MGVHEVLNTEQILNPTLAYFSMGDAGLRHINAGFIDQVSLGAEVCLWR
jgi:hypothetical protein